MNRPKLILTASLAVYISQFSTAQTFVGTTTGAPTWHRPEEGRPPTILSGTQTAVPYQSTILSVNTSGAYTFNMDAVANAWDTFAFLYNDPFNASAPLTNVLIGNNNLTNNNSEFTYNLTAGTQYVFVGTGNDYTQSGAYTLTVAGPGTATFGAVPEPASLSALALGGFALLRRRRASK